MSTVKELWAPKFMHGDRVTDAEQERMAKELGADSLHYLPLEAVARCIGLPEDNLCRACLTGDYPTPTGERLYQLALRQDDSDMNGSRTYEMATAAAAANRGCG